MATQTLQELLGLNEQGEEVTELPAPPPTPSLLKRAWEGVAHPIQAALQLPGAATSAVWFHSPEGLRRLIPGIQLLPEGEYKKLYNAYERAQSQQMQALSPEDFEETKKALEEIRKGNVPPTASGMIDFLRTSPGAGSVLAERLMPYYEERGPLGELGKTAIGFAGDVATDPLNVIGGALTKAGKWGLGAATKALLKEKDVVKAGAAIMGSPLMMAAYAPEIASGTTAGIEQFGEGLGEGNVEKALAGAGQAALLGGAGTLGVKGILAEGKVAAKVPHQVKWETSPLREKLIAETSSAAEGTGVSPENVTAWIEGTVDPIAASLHKQTGSFGFLETLAVERRTNEALPTPPGADVQAKLASLDKNLAGIEKRLETNPSNKFLLEHYKDFFTREKERLLGEQAAPADPSPEAIKAIADWAATETRRRGAYFPKKNLVALFENADFSTLVHEFFHAARPGAEELVHRGVWGKLEAWAGVKDGVWSKPAEEKFARAAEQFAIEGKAPLPHLEAPFRKVRDMMLDVYQLFKNKPGAISDDIRSAFSQMYGAPKEGSFVRGGTAISGLKPGQEAEIFLKYKGTGREVAIAKSLDDVLGKVILESGEIAIPGRGTIHDRLQLFAERGVTPEELSQIMQGRLSPDEIRDLTIEVSQLGLGLGRMSSAQKKAAEMARKRREEIAKDPEAADLLGKLTEGMGDGLTETQKVNLKIRRLWESVARGQGSTASLVKAAVAGTLQVAVYNTTNFLVHSGLMGLTDTMDLAGALLTGRRDVALHSWDRIRGQGEAMRMVIPNLIGELVDKAQSPFKPISRTGHTKTTRDFIKLLRTYGTEEHNKLLLHKSGADSPELVGKGTIDKLASSALDLNLMADRFGRLSVLSTHLTPLLRKHGVDNWHDLFVKAEGSPDVARDLSKYIEYGTMEALRATGGLTSPKGSMGDVVTQAINRFPGMWLVEPFPRYLFGTAYPVMIESFPFLWRLSRRARNSVEYPALRAELQSWRVNQKMLDGDFLLLSRDHEKLSPAERARFEVLSERGVSAENIKRASELNSINIKKREGELRQMKRDGLIDPTMVRKHSIYGPIMLAAFYAKRLQSGEDGTEWNQAKGKDDEAINLNHFLGPFAPYALMGDMLAHKALGTKKYEEREGFIRFRDMWRAIRSDQRYGPSLVDLLDEPVTSELQLRTLAQKFGANFGRMLATGAWPGDVLRRVDEEINPEARVRRRTDAPGPDNVVAALGEGIALGVQAQIPKLREDLPPAYNWATGKPYEVIRPAEPLTGDPTAPFSPEKPLLTLLPGRREKLNSITQFLDANRTLIDPPDVFPRRTDQPAYDEALAKNFADFVEMGVKPMMEIVKGMEKEQGARYFASLMRRARGQAEFMTQLEVARGKLPQPETLELRARKTMEGLVDLPLPLPPPKKPEHFPLLFLPSEEEEIP